MVATEDIAKTMTVLIRNIESISKASNAYDIAFDEVVNGGYGGWRVTTEFNDDDSFEQDIKIKALNTATTSLWFDDGSKEYDRRDAMWAFVTVDMPKEEPQRRFPKSPISSWSQEQYNTYSSQSWFGENTVRVAEYWIKTPVTSQLALLSVVRCI